jgi:hypothetical protein
MAESSDFVVICDGGAVCNPNVAQQTIDQRNAEAARVAAKAQRIYEWLQQIGFGPIHIDQYSGTGKFTLSVDEDRWCNSNNTSGQRTIACHSYSSSRCPPFGYTCREVILTDTAFTARELSGPADAIEGDVLAHEMSHGLNAAKITSSDPLWLGEAMADAIGRTWASQGNPPDEIGYLMSLDKPFHAGPDGGYEKSAYLEFLGRKRGSPGLIGYLASFFDLVGDGHEGMGYLYNAAHAGPGDTLFNYAFPEFVARYNNIDSTLDAGHLDFYDAYTRKSLIVQSWDMPWSTVHSASVEAFASDPVHIENLVVPNRPPDAESKDLVYVADYEITKAGNIGTLWLVYEHLVTANRKHRFMFQGDWGIDGGFVRVVNAGIIPSLTNAQPYEMTIRTSPIEFGLPACVGRGQSAEIEIEGADTTGVTNWQMKPEAGQIEELKFTAPNEPGPVKVTLEITSQITRQTGTIAPATPKIRKVDLGEIEVASESCDIVVQYSGHPLRIVYSTGGAYSMLDDAAGNLVFFDATRVAMKQGNNWVNVPPMAQSMIRGQIAQLANQPANSQRPPWAPPDPDMLWQMPLEMTKWYSWKEVTSYIFPGVPKKQVGQSHACPDGGTKCVRVVAPQLPGFALVYDEHRRIVQVDSGGRSMTITYGTAQGMVKPPGW